MMDRLGTYSGVDLRFLDALSTQQQNEKFLVALFLHVFWFVNQSETSCVLTLKDQVQRDLSQNHRGSPLTIEI